MSGFEYSRDVARTSRSNFYPAFRFLTPQRRDGLCAVYAFSRLVDDAVDQAINVERGKAEIALWRRRLLGCYEGGNAESHPLLPELRETIEHFEIPKEVFLDLLTGVEMDLTKRRYQTFAELEKYCYHVAGTVGLLCNQIFGAKTEVHREYAVLLGTAFQLTNILRDVGSDLERDRIYLPLEDLKRFSYPVSELEARVWNQSFFHLMQFESARARGYFEQAQLKLSEAAETEFLAAEVMRRFYSKILSKVVKKKFPVLRKKVSLNPLEKIAILTSTWVASKL
jgi:15-cis-phytoene synthase